MGNSIIKFLCAKCFKPSSSSHDSQTVDSVVSLFYRDLHHFESTDQVPDGLSQHVVSSKKAQANWYSKLSIAWRDEKPPPKTPEEAAWQIVLTLERHRKADVEGFLSFYILPSSYSLAGVKYKLHMLPVDGQSISVGNTIIVYVDIVDARESTNIPSEVREAATRTAKAISVKDYMSVDALRKSITDAGYKVISGSNGTETLAKKYRIRLRGIDASKSAMPFGKEAKEALVKLCEGKRLTVLIYGRNDLYGRLVGDIYFDSIFIREKMMRNGFAWHYAAYDKHTDLQHGRKKLVMVSEVCGLCQILRNLGTGGKIDAARLNQIE